MALLLVRTALRAHAGPWVRCASGYSAQCPPPQYDTGCTYCEPEYPESHPIDLERGLANTAVFHHRHIVVATGTAEWPSRIESTPGSLVNELKKMRTRAQLADYPVLVTNATLPDAGPDEFSVFVYPDAVHLPRLHRSQLPAFADAFLGDGRPLPADIEVAPAPAIVGVCGHGARDLRCGLAAPILEAEFRASLEREPGPDVHVCSLSHVGGHKFAGNVVCFGPDGGTVWYGRVRTRDVQGIVRETVRGGRVIDDIHRGGLAPGK
ncbi:Sucrase/ferredoxin-like-domain-containing protein [Dipodascopsis tothii]|uniref:Sucrase/ferredoxin-like-domain-containing protein n=1 Tax=Dipodascopsis tothii TaxID=44089 RepID=UPI0034CF4C64